MKNILRYCGSALIVYSVGIYAGANEELIDLNCYQQDFIIDMKQITVPGFPGAFNAAMMPWKDGIFMVFRVRDENMVSNFKIGCVMLDNNFSPLSEPHILEIYNDDVRCLLRKQDPRLIVIENALYIIYSDSIKIDDMMTRRMFIAEIQEQQGRFFVDRPFCLDPFEGSDKRWQKNWSPFVYGDQLMLVYSLMPHRVMQPLVKEGGCFTHSSTCSKMTWDWGHLRGGTPALLDGDHYIAFFHSSKPMTTSYSKGKKIPHYVMGAYRFSAKPPFAITHISPYPIIDKTFYESPAYTTWKPLRVVFPMGCFILYEDGKKYMMVSYGKQDFEIWVMKVDLDRLYASLVECPLADEITLCPEEKYNAFSLRDLLYEDRYSSYLARAMLPFEQGDDREELSEELS